MKKKRLWLIPGIILVLGVGGFIIINNNRSDAISYRFEKVDRGDIIVSISATGSLSALTTVQVGSQVSGTISHLYADFNSVVKAGQLIAQLDPTFLQASVNEQKANVDRTTAQVNEAERNFARTSDLFSKNLVSQADLDAATTSLESARASLKQAYAALERVQVNLRYATIRSPIDGVVISRNVDVGQTVAASLQAPTLFTIANDLRKMQVQASVDEADIGNVKVGQHVTFRVDAYPEEEFDGVVSQIRLSPVVTQNVVTYAVIIDVDNPRQRLMPGMTATVSIEVAKRENVLRVPLLATRFIPPGADRALPPMEAGRMMRDTTGGERPQPSTTEGGEQRRRGGPGGGEMAGRRGPGEQGMQRPMGRARVWVLEGGEPKAVIFARGIQNTRHMEIMRGDLNEGDEVVIGMTGGSAQAQTAQNPFAPQRMTGGRRGGF